MGAVKRIRPGAAMVYFAWHARCSATGMGNEPETVFVAQEAGERRRTDRRAPSRLLDPLFAATLVNQIAPAETVYAPGYAARRGPRPGVAFDLRA